MGFEVLGLTALARCLGNSSTVRHEPAGFAEMAYAAYVPVRFG